MRLPGRTARKPIRSSDSRFGAIEHADDGAAAAVDARGRSAVSGRPGRRTDMVDRVASERRGEIMRSAGQRGTGAEMKNRRGSRPGRQAPETAACRPDPPASRRAAIFPKRTDDFLESNAVRTEGPALRPRLPRQRCLDVRTPLGSRPADFERAPGAPGTPTFRANASPRLFRGRSSSRFYRLPRNGASNALRTGTDSAHGDFTSPRPLRTRALRHGARNGEVARLAGFGFTKRRGARQIGNAAPPPLGRAVAAQILRAPGVSPLLSSDALEPGDRALSRMDMSDAARYRRIPVPQTRPQERRPETKAGRQPSRRGFACLTSPTNEAIEACRRPKTGSTRARRQAFTPP